MFVKSKNAVTQKKTENSAHVIEKYTLLDLVLEFVVGPNTTPRNRLVR